MITFVLICIVAALVLLSIIFVGFIKNDEGTAVTFEQAGGFVATVMQFAGHHFEGGFIKIGDGPDQQTGKSWFIWRYRGWIFYLRFLVQPVAYQDYNQPDKFGEKYATFLNDRQTVLTLLGIYTSDNIAMDVEVAVVKRIVNPHLVLFAGPEDVIEQADERVRGAVKTWVKLRTEQEVQENRGNGPALWKDITTDEKINYGPIFNSTRDDWGVDIVKDSIIIVKAVPSDPLIRDALQLQRKAKLKADADLLSKSIEAQADAQEMLGPIMAAWITMKGLSPEEAKVAIAKDKALQKEWIAYVQNLNAELRKADKKAFFEVKSGGNFINEAIVLLSKLSGVGAGAAANQGSQQNPTATEGDQKKYQKMTPEQAREAYREEFGHDI